MSFETSFRNFISLFFLTCKVLSFPRVSTREQCNCNGQSENCNTQKQKNVNLTAISFIKNVWGNWRLNSPKMHWHFCYKNILLLLTQSKNLAIGVIMKFEFRASCEGTFCKQTRILMNKNYEEIKGPKGLTRECK